MVQRSVLTLPALAIVMTMAGPADAQTDPLSRFLNGLFKSDPPAANPAPAPSAPEPSSMQGKPAPRAAGADQAGRAVKPKAAAARSEPQPPSQERPAAAGNAGERPSKTAAKPAPKPVAAARPEVADARPADVAAPQEAAVQPVAAPVPSTPQAALERLNAYFNSIDQLTASFTQTSPSGRMSGTLAMKRPGQLQFAYAPPSTLEVVSDGRSVAVRDRKLGTNDVYPVGQTPLKFLLKDDFDLGRDTKVRDVNTSADGMVTVKFEDNATFGGTSRISLRFDARTNTLKQWTIVDPQGFETTVTLSDVQVVRRRSAGIVN